MNDLTGFIENAAKPAGSWQDWLCKEAVESGPKTQRTLLSWTSYGFFIPPARWPRIFVPKIAVRPEHAADSFESVSSIGLGWPCPVLRVTVE